jgi:thioredoxin 1
MKMIRFLILIPVFILASCQDRPKEANNQEEQVSEQQTVESPVSGNVVHLDKAAFLSKVHNFEASRDWKFEGSRPALIDFYADWCKPCKIVAPYFEEFAKKYEGKIDIYKVNVDQQQEIAAFYGISSIPTFFFIDSKGQVFGDMGAKPKEFYEQRILEMIGETAAAPVN